MSKNLSGVQPEIRSLLKYGLISYPCVVSADASSGLSFDLPVEMNIVDVIGRSTATVASATATVSDGTNDITGALDIDTLDVNTSAGSIDSTYSQVSSVTITTASSSDRAIVYVIGYPVV